MKDHTRHEIADIIRELNFIVRELESLSVGVTRDFKGIGSTFCANGLEDLSRRYRYVARELNKII